MNNNKATTTSFNSLFNPTYNTNWAFKYTQPLLRGPKIDSNRQSISVTKINRDISDVQLRATITNTLSNVREAYWNYVFAVQSVEVAKQSLDARRTARAGQPDPRAGRHHGAARRRPGAVAGGDRAAEPRRPRRPRCAPTSWRSSTLIVSGTEDPIWNSTIDPVDRPDFRPEAVDVEGAVRRALSERTDLAIAKKNLAVERRHGEVSPEPAAAAGGSRGASTAWSGLGGDLLAKSGSGVNQVATGDLAPGGYSDALSTLFRTAYPRWTVTLNFSYPLGLSSAQAVVARARVQQNQDLGAGEGRSSCRSRPTSPTPRSPSQSNIERVQAAQVARELAAAAARRREQQVRGRHVHQLPGRAGRSAIWRPRRTTSCRRFWTIATRSSSSSACSRRRCRTSASRS